MFIRYLKIIQQVFWSNIELLAYIFMIVETIRQPGFATIVYPISVFGYALMEETKPKKYFWYFILLYT